MRMTLLALLAAPLPALAADLPPAPPVGAPIEERLYLASASVDPLDLLVARVSCVAFQRATIAARLNAGLLSRGWSSEADRLWRLSEALSAFEATHIRPYVDEDTEVALLEAYAPTALVAVEPGADREHGLRPEPGATAQGRSAGAEPPDPRHVRCGSFSDAFMLRRVLG